MEDYINATKSMLNDPDKFAEFVNERFDNTDTDKNELIDIAELEKALIEIRERMDLPKPSEDEVRNILDTYDADKSGALDKKEFAEFCRSVLNDFLKKNQP